MPRGSFASRGASIFVKEQNCACFARSQTCPSKKNLKLSAVWFRRIWHFGSRLPACRQAAARRCPARVHRRVDERRGRFLPRGYNGLYMDNEEQLLQETHRLAKENNRMLHAMRRNAFWGGIIKFLVYIAIVLVPLWFYATYLAPTVDQMMHTMDQLQGTGAKAQAQFSGIEDALKVFQEKFSQPQQ